MLLRNLPIHVSFNIFLFVYSSFTNQTNIIFPTFVLFSHCILFSLPFQSFFIPLHAPFPSILSSPKPPHWPSPSNRMIIWHNVTPSRCMIGAVSQLLLPSPSLQTHISFCWWLVLVFVKKEKWSGEDEWIWGREREKREFHAQVVTRLVSTGWTCHLSQEGCCSLSASDRFLFLFSAFHRMAPIMSICAFRTTKK